MMFLYLNFLFMSLVYNTYSIVVSVVYLFHAVTGELFCINFLLMSLVCIKRFSCLKK